MYRLIDRLICIQWTDSFPYYVRTSSRDDSMHRKPLDRKERASGADISVVMTSSNRGDSCSVTSPPPLVVDWQFHIIDPCRFSRLLCCLHLWSYIQLNIYVYISVYMYIWVCICDYRYEPAPTSRAKPRFGFWNICLDERWKEKIIFVCTLRSKQS